MRKKDGTGEINLPDFRLYYKATVIKTIWYWHKDRNIDQWNSTENPEISPFTYGRLIYDKGRTTQCWKDRLFIKWCWENWTAACKEMVLDHSLTPDTKISSKWIKDLNVRLDTIKLSEKIISRTLSNINHSNTFSDFSPKIMKIKAKINK